METERIIIFVLAVLGVPAYGQITNIETYRKNAVRIETGNEKGSGFICAHIKDSVFILTATHVIHKTKHPIAITIDDYGTFNGQVLYADSANDVAMLGLLVKDFKWFPGSIATNVELGDQVFFVTLAEASRPLLPRGSIATIDKWDFDKGIQYITTTSVFGGDSGSALLCVNGIAGMILSRHVKSIDIRKIRDLILAWDATKWQLEETR